MLIFFFFFLEKKCYCNNPKYWDRQAWANSVDQDLMPQNDQGLQCLPLIQHYFRYRIRPNYRTVRLGFSKLLGTLSCGKICIYLLRLHYKKDKKKTFDYNYAVFFFLIFFIKTCCGYSFELHRQVDAIQMCTHNICLNEEVDKKYTGCDEDYRNFLTVLL